MQQNKGILDQHNQRNLFSTV